MPTWFVTPAADFAPDEAEPAWSPLGAGLPAALAPVRPITPIPGLTDTETFRVLRRLPASYARLRAGYTLRIELPDDPLVPVTLESLVTNGWATAAWKARPMPPQSVDVRAPTGEPATEPYLQRIEQRYLGDPAGGGIGLSSARKHMRGEARLGAGARISVVERGWNRAHKDLPPALPLLRGVLGHPKHGTRSLGLLFMEPANAFGGEGLAPGAEAAVFSPCDDETAEPESPGTTDAILRAAAWAGRGGVVLLEEQGWSGDPSCEYGPAELDIANLVAIGLASWWYGCVVVEPAGDSPTRLDRWRDRWGRRVARGRASFIDSGAVMVGGATCSARPGRWHPYPASAVGRRVDCLGPAYDLWTTDHSGGYSEFFNATSSASAIVAGLATIMAAVAKERGRPWSRGRARKLLSNPALGTPVADTRYKPRVPDLAKILRVL